MIDPIKLLKLDIKRGLSIKKEHLDKLSVVLLTKEKLEIYKMLVEQRYVLVADIDEYIQVDCILTDIEEDKWAHH